MLLQTGPMRLAFLNADGTKAKTLILPAPEKGGKGLEWIQESDTEKLVSRAPRTRLYGFVPRLTCRWTQGYDERSGRYVIGTGDGQKPALEDLLWFLSQPSGKIRVSPGLSAGGFTVDSMAVKPIGRRGNVYTGLEVVFTGRDIFQTMTLELF